VARYTAVASLEGGWCWSREEVAAMAGSSGFGGGTNLPNPDSSPRIFDKSIPCCQYDREGCDLCTKFSGSNETFDVSVRKDLKFHQLLGEFDYILTMLS
jgi:hypothetical protein